MLLLALFTSPSFAATWTVGPGETFSTIQAAIDAASDGDILAIDAGTYTECVDLSGRDLTLQGAGRRETLLLGDGTCAAALTVALGETAEITGMAITNAGARAIAVEDATVTFSDVAVRDSGDPASEGGGASISGGDVRFEDSVFQGNVASLGGALFLTRGATVTLVDTDVLEGQATSGGGIYVAFASDLPCTLTLDSARLIENHATAAGAGIYLDEQTTLRSQSSLFSSNAGDGVQGAALYAGANAVLSSTDDVFDANLSTNPDADISGAIYLASNNTLTVDGSVFSSNEGGRGGAITALGYGDLSIQGAHFEDNSVWYAGGAIYAEDHVDLQLTDSSFTGNACTFGSGGAISLDSGGSFTVTGGAFSANEAKKYGGAVALSTEVSAALRDVAFDGNSAGGMGGALYATATEAPILEGLDFNENTGGSCGGAVYLSNLSGETTLSAVTMTGNSTDAAGGGLCAYQATDVRIEDSAFDENIGEQGGGAILSTLWSNLFVANTSFTHNVGGDAGGAIYYVYDDSWGTTTLHVENSAFADNTSRTLGGAIYSDFAGATEISGSTFDHNEGGYGGALYLYANGALSVTGSRFCSNKSTNGGAAMDLYYAGEPGGDRWENNTFVENQATRMGGALFISGAGTVSVVNNDLLGNSAADAGGGVHAFDVKLLFTNNVVAWTGAGDGVYSGDDVSGAAGTFTYNDWYENRAADGGGAYDVSTGSDGNISAAPDFADLSLDGDCDNDDLRLTRGSALIDAGDPEILDPDGTSSDIGATGGTGAPDDGGYPEPADTGDSGGPTETGEAEDTGARAKPEDTGTKGIHAHTGCATGGGRTPRLGWSIGLIAALLARRTRSR